MIGFVESVLTSFFWIIVCVVIFWVTRSRTERRVRKLLKKHEHLFDTVTTRDLPSEWEGMITSLKYTKKQADALAQTYDQEKLASLTQPRVLVTATCACAHTKVVLVYGKHAEAVQSGDVQAMLTA